MFILFLIYKIMVNFPISGNLNSIKYHISCSNSKPAFSLRGRTIAIYNHHCHFSGSLLKQRKEKEEQRKKLEQHFSLHNPAEIERKKRTTYVEKFSKIKVTELGEEKTRGRGKPKSSLLRKMRDKEETEPVNFTDQSLARTVDPWPLDSAPARISGLCVFTG